MKMLILGLVATVALATAATASAHHNPGEHGRGSFDLHAFNRGMDHGLKRGFWAHRGAVAVLSGTGTSFGGTNPTVSGSVVGGNDHQNGHFTLGLTTDWSAAQTKTFTDDDSGTVTVTCAPSTATVTLTNGSTSSSTLTGKACQLTQNGTSRYGFVGVSSDGSTKGFFREDSDGTTVKGVVFTRAGGGGDH